MDPENLSGKFPWITKEGFFDPAQFPIDVVLTYRSLKTGGGSGKHGKASLSYKSEGKSHKERSFS